MVSLARQSTKCLPHVPCERSLDRPCDGRLHRALPAPCCPAPVKVRSSSDIGQHSLTLQHYGGSHRLTSSKWRLSAGTVIPSRVLLVSAVLLGMTSLLGAWAAPLPPAMAFFEDETQRYLMQYGYLPMSDMEMGNLRTDQELVQAVKRLQRFGHIPETGVVDAATRSLMRRPRCALPDIEPDDVSGGGRVRRYIKQGSSWDKTDLTWGLISYPGQPDGSTVAREVRLAAELWARPSRLTFQQLTDRPASADIVLQFNRGYHGDGYPFDGAGRTLAHAFYPGPGIGGDIHFDADEKWVQHADSSNSSYEEISLFLTAGHELGHALGLYHSQAKNSIMSPYLFSYGPGPFLLPHDDVAGIQDLYGVNENYESPTSDEPSVGPSFPDSPDSSSPGPPSSYPTLVPDTCDTSYDAISVIRRGIYIFRGKYFWRIDERTPIQEPVELTRFWYCLPPNITRVDAVYERPNQDTIVFFSDREYFVCRGNDVLVESGPLRRLGLPDDLAKLDAAFVWGHNTRTYFMADTMYWRFDESIKHVELDYPRDMTMWKGVPYGDIDAAFKFNGTTYFFKGKFFYEFDDLRMKVRPKSPMLSAPFWMSCPDNVANPHYAPGDTSAAAPSSFTIPFTVTAVVLLVVASGCHLT